MWAMRCAASRCKLNPEGGFSLFALGVFSMTGPVWVQALALLAVGVPIACIVLPLAVLAVGGIIGCAECACCRLGIIKSAPGVLTISRRDLSHA